MSIIIIILNLLSVLIRFGPSKSFRLKLPQLQALFVDSIGLVIDKLGFFDIIRKDLRIDLFFKVKILSNR